MTKEESKIGELFHIHRTISNTSFILFCSRNIYCISIFDMKDEYVISNLATLIDLLQLARAIHESIKLNYKIVRELISLYSYGN